MDFIERMDNMDVLTRKVKPRQESRTYSVDDIIDMLNIGRTAAYNLIRKSLATKEPFTTIRIGNTIRVSKRSFDEYMDTVGL